MIGERLKELRKDHGLSREQLGTILSLSTHTIASYERENSEPNDEIKIKICEYFNVSSDYLIGLTNRQSKLYDKNTKVIVIPDYFDDDAIEDLEMFISYLSYKAMASKQ